MISTVLVAAGIVVLVVVWSSVLRSLVPRQTPPRATRWTARWTAILAIALARRLAPGPRERMMTMAAPVSLLVLLSWWLACHVLGFVLLAAGLTGMSMDSVLMGLFFTLGTTGGTRIIGLLCWLGLFVLIGLYVVYLGAVMNAYHRRELLSVRLSAEAERPPDAEHILAAYVRSRSRTRLDSLFADWTGWLADIRCSHVNYPTLVFMRPAGQLCWLEAAVIMLDAAALLEAIAPSWAMSYTKALLDTGIRCFEKLGTDLGIKRATSAVSLQGREQYGFDDTTRITASAGLPPERGPDEAWRVFQALRTRYAPCSTAIALLLLHNMVDASSTELSVNER